jgi:hypothetical protein
MKRANLFIIWSLQTASMFVGLAFAQTATEAYNAGNAYFPKSAFANLTYDAFLPNVFGQHLHALEETGLSGYDKNTFAVRCLWMSPYKGDELVRIAAQDGRSATATYKRSDADSPGVSHRFYSNNLTVSQDAVSKLGAKIESDGVMSQPNKQDVLSSDGPIWLLEVYDHGYYRASYKVDPNSGPFTQTCLSAARLAQAPVDIQ